MSAAEKWNKAQRLQVAGSAAPRLRGKAEEAAGRRVARVDADGNIIGYTTLADVQKKLLERAQIEFDVASGRKTHFVCRACGRLARVGKAKGAIPARCPTCITAKCETCGDEFQPYAGLKRKPRKGPKKCGPCRQTPEVTFCACGAKVPRQSAWAAKKAGRDAQCRGCFLKSKKDAVVCATCKEVLPQQSTARRRIRDNGWTPRCRACWKTDHRPAQARKETP